MKVLKVTATNNETSSSLDLFEGRRLSADAKDRIREEVGTYLIEQTLASIAETKSPVQGETIPSLRPGPYRKKKLEELGTSRADLQFSGETLDELTFKPTKEGIKIGVFGERAPILDGHSNLSGKSSLPRRRLVPDESQKYKKEIETEVKRIVLDAIAEETEFTEADFKNVETRQDLYAVLRSKFGDISRAELSLLVFRNDALIDLLKGLKLLKLIS